jgi:hypothetical protein
MIESATDPHGRTQTGSLRKTPVNVSAVQEADQFDCISGKLQPQAVIANPQPVITVITLNFLKMTEFIQCVDCLQCFDDFKKSFLYAGVAGDSLKIFQECFGV